MRGFIAGCLFVVVACGPGARNHQGDDDDDDGSGNDACVGLQCQVADCSGQAQPTSLEGYVYAPNGTLPLYNVNVYVPNDDPGPITTGLDGQCDQCANSPPGNPVAITQSDEHGHFVLPAVPTAANMPVVIQIGKWRKILTIAAPVAKCTTMMLPTIDTKLPSKRTESGGDIKSVDMPQIAVSTGNFDALECLLRKVGIDDSEFSSSTGSGRVHLFTDVGATEDFGGFDLSGQGADRFATGSMMINSQALWGTATAGTDSLGKYDIVMMSCEGAQYPASKSQAAMDAVKQYADGGGRLFLSHWHNIWIGGDQMGSAKPADWPSLASFPDADEFSDDIQDTIVTDATENPKGMSFATWMLDPHVMGSTTADQVTITGGTGYSTCTSVDTTNVETWVTYNGSGSNRIQNFQFSTPNEQPEGSRCGKVVFSDMHVSGDSSSNPGTSGAFPSGCSSAGLTAQEKALAFMFFDIAACVGQPIGRTLP